MLLLHRYAIEYELHDRADFELRKMRVRIQMGRLLDGTRETATEDYPCIWFQYSIELLLSRTKRKTRMLGELANHGTATASQSRGRSNGLRDATTPFPCPNAH